VRLKAMFDNEDEQLWPGDFVNARLLRSATTFSPFPHKRSSVARTVYLPGLSWMMTSVNLICRISLRKLSRSAISWQCCVTKFHALRTPPGAAGRAAYLRSFSPPTRAPLALTLLTGDYRFGPVTTIEQNPVVVIVNPKDGQDQLALSLLIWCNSRRM
jgi:hypothetical protein